MANAHFPGVLVLTDTVVSWRFPDTLVVWHPPAPVLGAHPERLPLSDPDRRPYFDELVIYTPADGASHQLLEIAVPDDSRLVPSVADTASWRSEIGAIKSSHSGNEVVLTDLLHTAEVSDESQTTRHAALRFELRLRPSSSDWTAYEGGTLAWDRLPWVQGIYTDRTGLRQSWVRIEMQLMPQQTTEQAQPIPFFGSASVIYLMHSSS
jgi:hypothetical protein